MANINNPQRIPRPIPTTHLSLQLGSSAPYKWALVLDANGNYVRVPATQGSIDMMENSRLMYLLVVLRAIRGFIGGQKIINKWVNVSSGFSHIFRDLNPVYRMDKLDDGNGGTWTTDPSGKHYSIENYAMESVQKLCLNKDNFALVVQLPQEMKDFLNIKVSGTKIVVGANFSLPSIPSTYDKTIMQSGPITCEHPMKKLTLDQLAKVTAATVAHQHSSDPHEHPDEEESHKSVQELLRLFEESAIDEEQHHFFTMLQFNGGKDSRWSHEDGDLIGKLEDVTWNFWLEELIKPAPNWGLSHYWEIAHQQAHALYAFNTMAVPTDVQMLYRFPVFDNGVARRIADCPEENQAQVVTRMRAGALLKGLS